MRSLQLAVAQFRPRKGEYAANLDHLGSIFAQADALRPRPQVIHLPETALTGYFLEGGVRELSTTAGALARDLDDVYRRTVSGAGTMDVVVGFYELFRDTLYNSMAYVTLGAGEPLIRHVHRKVFLPTYGLFDEERYVERGHEIRAFDTAWGRAAMLVCEDAWHSLTGTLAALDGAQVIFLSAAAPARGVWPRDDAIPGPGSVARWDRLVRDIAEEHGVFVSFANLVATEGGKTFPGGSLICGPRGDVRVRGPLWSEALVTLPADLGDIARARADMPLLSDLRTALPHLIGTLGDLRAGTGAALGYDDAGEVSAPVEDRALVHPDASATSSAPMPIIRPRSEMEAGAPPSLEVDAPLVAEWLTHFLREEVHGRGFERGIVALSGGVDSAVTTYLAARALGPENVIALRLPYRSSSPDSLDHAQLVIDALGVRAETIDISDAVDGYLARADGADDTRRGNVMARMRMIALFDRSAANRAIPLGTGNKSERLLGYFTWHADDSPPVNPIGDLYKTQVWTLARHLGVPAEIIDKPATADLATGQTDEGDLGITYPQADRILHWLLSGYSEAEMEARGFDAAQIALVRKRLDGTHWKRRLPSVAMMSATAIGESYLRPVDY